MSAHKTTIILPNGITIVTEENRLEIHGLEKQKIYVPDIGTGAQETGAQKIRPYVRRNNLGASGALRQDIVANPHLYRFLESSDIKKRVDSVFPLEGTEKHRRNACGGAIFVLCADGLLKRSPHPKRPKGFVYSSTLLA